MDQILFITPSYYPNIGGVEKHVYELSKVLARRGYGVTILTEDRFQKLPNHFDYRIRGVKVIRIPVGEENWFKKFRIWQWMWKNKDFIFSHDIIHCHDVFYWYLPLALINPLKDVYTTFHGYESYPVKFKAAIYRKIFEYMSSKTICVGDFMRKWYYARPTVVSYGGVDLPKKMISTKKDTAIFIGRLDEQTGIQVYAEAVELIRKKHPKFTLTVYGDGPLRSTIKGDGVEVKGFIANADQLIQRYEYAFISRNLGILEALAARRQVIAVYDNPLKKDYLEMTPYKNWIEICASAQEVARVVLDNNDNKSSIKQAFSFVQKLSWEHLAEIYLLLWKKN